MVGKNKNSKAVAERIPVGSTGVELGVWKGDTSRIFLDRLGSKGFLHMVDSWSVEPYKGSKEHGDYDNYLSRYESIVGSKKPEDFQKYYDNVYEAVMQEFCMKEATGNCFVRRMSSDEFFSESFSDRNLLGPIGIYQSPPDWIYIDASHDYEQVLKDLENSKKLLGEGGIIWGDDYSNKPGVKAAVNEFSFRHDIPIDVFAGNQYELKL